MATMYMCRVTRSPSLRIPVLFGEGTHMLSGPEVVLATSSFILGEA